MVEATAGVYRKVTPTMSIRKHSAATYASSVNNHSTTARRLASGTQSRAPATSDDSTAINNTQNMLVEKATFFSRSMRTLAADRAASAKTTAVRPA